jgi:hypothetical protein
MSRNLNRLCFNQYEPTTTTFNGPSRYYVLNAANPGSAVPVTPILNAFTTVLPCRFASDERTLVYFAYDAGLVIWRAYVVDSQNPGTPALLAPPGESTAEQGAWQIADGAMRVAVAYFDTDGIGGIGGSEVGRYYSIPLDGNGAPFLFSDAYSFGINSSAFFDSNEDGSFVLYGRAQSGRGALEIMSTRGLNLSILLSKGTEIIGLKRAKWMHRAPYNF